MPDGLDHCFMAPAPGAHRIRETDEVESSDRMSRAELNVIGLLSLFVEIAFDLVTGMADWMLSLQLLALLGVANGTPILAKKLLQDRLSTR